VVSILKLTEDGFDILFDNIGKEDQPNDDEYTSTFRAIAILLYYLIINGRSKYNNALNETCPIHFKEELPIAKFNIGISLSCVFNMSC
jgi:hypothetical protein